MAEAVLFSLATDILEGLASFASQKIQLLCDGKDELQSLQLTVQTIQAVLLDAEKQQWHNNGVKLWLKRLKDVLYDVQDLLDDVATEALRRKVTVGNRMSKPVRFLSSKLKELAHRPEVAKKIQELRKKLDEIREDSKLLKLVEHRGEETAAIERGKKRERVPSPDEYIIGREEDKKRIKQFLFHSSSNKGVSCVAIVGKGGLGKTALARLVYNDGEVQKHFDLKMWACVSDVFDVNSIIKELLKSANCRDLENKTLDQLLNLLRETLSRKKYLLVLDDLWNEDRDKWSKLGEWLEGGERGSKILVTTRSRKVAKVTHAKSDVYDLRGLSEDESWNLFKENAFEEGEEESLDSEQEKVGRDFVKKCAGVPLAVRTIGGFFYGKTKNEWLLYEGRELLEIPEVDKADDGILQVLKFSYDHLLSCLKHCFAYCSLFRKDFVYDKQMMIHLWMAQGFIESDGGKDNLEEVADTYVTELLCRSFLDVETKGDDGEVLTFKMHDLMHDLAKKVAGGECENIKFEGRDCDGAIRHASVFSNILPEERMVSLLKAASKFRTFLYSESTNIMSPMSSSFESEPSALDFHNVLSELRRCRALVLWNTDIPLPPSPSEKLKHLRFLKISRNQSIQSLPDSITDLVNLQHLELHDCEKLKKFPRDLRKLINLRYFSIIFCRSVSHLPPLSELPSLRTLILHQLDALEFVQQTGEVGQSRTALPFFPSLETLCLSICLKLKGWWESRQSETARPFFPKLRDVQIRNCYRLIFVPPFPQVERLTISQARKLKIMPDPNCPSEAAVGSRVTPFSKLNRLYLGGNNVEFPMLQTLLQSANNLEFMRLASCDIRSFSRVMRHLSSLQELHVRHCDGLDLSCKEGDQHETPWSFLTNLRVLKISYCEDLMQLPEGIQYVTTLQSLEIYNCWKLESLQWIANLSSRNLASLKELRIRNCPALRKQDWPHIANNPVIVWED